MIERIRIRFRRAIAAITHPHGGCGFPTRGGGEEQKLMNATDKTGVTREALWTEVDLGAVADNVRALKGLLQPGCRLMAVVKADGYGHGASEVARTALENGASHLGVARLAEGIDLRRAGIGAPILIFGYTHPEDVPHLLRYDLTQALYSPATAEAYSQRAAAGGGTLPVHIKIDTGMGRLGLLPERLKRPGKGAGSESRLVEKIDSIARLPSLAIVGIFTHFAAADSVDKAYSHRQLDIFLSTLQQLESSGIGPGLRHAANSAAVMELPESHLDMVRPGISIYGLYPSPEIDKDRIRLSPAMALKTRIIHLKRVPAGFKVSYGMTYTTTRPTTIATVPVGYADGYSRGLSSKGHMLVGGAKVPVVGRVCMDLTMLDVGGVGGVEPGDEVVVFGRQGAEQISADEVAAAIGTINYEIVSSLTARVPRTYI